MQVYSRTSPFLKPLAAEPEESVIRILRGIETAIAHPATPFPLQMVGVGSELVLIHIGWKLSLDQASGLAIYERDVGLFQPDSVAGEQR